MIAHRLLLVGAAALALLPLTAEAAHLHHRHRHHRAPEPVAVEGMVPPPPVENRAAESSGAAFGLLDLGISATPTAISPYAHYDHGTVRPGFGYPGY